MRMINIFAIALESRVNLLFAKMKGVRPTNVSIFHQKDIRIIAIILGFKKTVVKTRVSHENNVIQI
jgi:hypothetical protein